MKKTKSVAILLVLVAAVSVYIAAAPSPRAVSVAVTIEPKLSDGVTDTRILGDQAPYDNIYIDGADGVTAQISSGGTLWMNFWPQTDSGLREVYFDHSHTAPYPSPETLHPELVRTYYPSGYGENTKVNSSFRDSNSVAMQNMANNSSQCLKFWWASRIMVSGQKYSGRDNFHSIDADTATTPDTKAAYVIVTRIDTNNWTLESNPSPTLGDLCHNSNQTGQAPASMALHDETITSTGKHPTTSTYTVRDGYYYMPFRLTVTRK